MNWLTTRRRPRAALPPHRVGTGLTMLGIMTCALMAVQPAHAYRPFDSTDASVAASGEIEVECGPFGYVIDAGDRFLVVPAAILNFGLVNRWELVLEARNFIHLDVPVDERRSSLRDAALSLKGVLRQGTLQGRRGPSIATEVGLLLPTNGPEKGVGTSVAGIVSQRWSNVTVHVNGALLMTHEHTLGAVGGAIVEGPFRWPVRPVAEFNIADEESRTVSGILGAIWQVRDGLSLDVGWRVARVDGSRGREVRAGFTWAAPLRRS